MNLSCCLIMLVSQPWLPASGLDRHWLVDILADRVHFAESQQEVSLLSSRKLQLFSLWHMPLFAHSAERALLPCARMCRHTHLCTAHVALLHAHLPGLNVIACGRHATCQAWQDYIAETKATTHLINALAKLYRPAVERRVEGIEDGNF